MFMPERLPLSAADLSEMLPSLRGDSFSGYIQLELPNSQTGYLFLSGGRELRCFVRDATGEATFYTSERLFAKAGEESLPVSSYVLSAEMASVLAYSFAFETRPGPDWKAAIQQDKQSGFVWFGEQAVLFSRGEALSETLAQRYGEVICGREAVNKLLTENQPTHYCGQLQPVLEQRARQLSRDLERMREVKLKSVSGFFASKDSLKIETVLAEDWDLGGKNHFVTVVEDLNRRRIGTLKTYHGCKKHQTIEIPLKVMQEWGLSEDQVVIIYPASD